MLFESIFSGIWALILVFAVCEFCQRMTNIYHEINFTVYQIDWYKPPIEIQRMLLIILIYTEQPLDFEFFGSMTCNREQFKRVSKSF